MYIPCPLRLAKSIPIQSQFEPHRSIKQMQKGKGTCFMSWMSKAAILQTLPPLFAKPRSIKTDRKAIWNVLPISPLWNGLSFKLPCLFDHSRELVIEMFIGWFNDWLF